MMNITEKTKSELEHRLSRLENFIANKGIGSSYLNRAKKVQRNVNLAIALGCVVTIAGITVWALNGSKHEEE